MGTDDPEELREQRRRARSAKRAQTTAKHLNENSGLTAALTLDDDVALDELQATAVLSPTSPSPVKVSPKASAQWFSVNGGDGALSLHPARLTRSPSVRRQASMVRRCARRRSSRLEDGTRKAVGSPPTAAQDALHLTGVPFLDDEGGSGVSRDSVRRRSSQNLGRQSSLQVLARRASETPADSPMLSKREPSLQSFARRASSGGDRARGPDPGRRAAPAAAEPPAGSPCGSQSTKGDPEQDDAAHARYFGALGSTAVMRELCRRPVDVAAVRRVATLHPSGINLRNQLGWNALHMAVMLVGSRFARDEVVQFLLRLGANLYAPDDQRRTPFTVAAQSRRSRGDEVMQGVADAIRQYQLWAEPQVTMHGQVHNALLLPAPLTSLSVSTLPDASPAAQGCPMLYAVLADGRVYLLSTAQQSPTRRGGASFPRRLLVHQSPGLRCVRPIAQRSTDPRMRTELLYGSDGTVLQVSQTLTDVLDAQLAWARDCISPKARRRWALVMRATLMGFGGRLLAKPPPAASPGVQSPSPRAGAQHGSQSPRRSDGLPRSPQSPPQPQRVDTVFHTWDEEDIDGPIDGWHLHVRAVCDPNEALSWFHPSAVHFDVLGKPQETASPCDTCCADAAAAAFAVARPASGKSDRGPFVFEIFETQGLSLREPFRALAAGDASAARHYSCALRARPLAVRHAGNGTFACLCTEGDPSERLTVYSACLGRVFYRVRLMGAAQCPLELHARCCPDPEALVATGENSGIGRTVSSLVVVLDRSVEVHKLLLTRAQFTAVRRNLGPGVGLAAENSTVRAMGTSKMPKGQFTSELCLHIHNSNMGGRYTAQFHPVEDSVALMRGAGTELDMCVMDLSFWRNYYACKLQAVYEVLEKSCSGPMALRFAPGSDGRYMIRHNVAEGTLTTYDWGKHVTAHIDTKLGRYTNVCFAPVHGANMDADYRIQAPTGFVSLVFTDVQSSTELWENAAVYMEPALELHNNLLRKLLLRFSGYEVKTEGDAFMCAFEHAVDGLNWCLASQLYLRLLPWPPELIDMFDSTKEVLIPAEDTDTEDGGLTAEEQEADFKAMVQADLCKAQGPDVHLADIPYNKHLWRGPRVRMGLHCCTPLCRLDPETGRMDYFGPPVNLAARVSGVGRGGQIVLSDEAREQLGLEVDPEEEDEASGVDGAERPGPICDVQVTPIGRIRLKGIREEKMLYEVLPALLAARSDEFYEHAIAAGTRPPSARPRRPRSAGASGGQASGDSESALGASALGASALGASTADRPPPAAPPPEGPSQDPAPSWAVRDTALPAAASRRGLMFVQSEGEAGAAAGAGGAEDAAAEPPLAGGARPRPRCRRCAHTFTDYRQRFCPMCGRRRGFVFTNL